MKTLYTQAELQTLARSNGWPAKDAEVAAAVFMAESLTYVGDRVYANSVKIGDLNLMDDLWGPSVGVPQVRTRKSGTPQHRNYEWLYGNVNRQLASALLIFRDAQGWRPWSAHTNGSYQAFMQAATLNPVPPKPSNMHLVSAGESLSKVAGLPQYKGRFSWRALAAANAMLPPYTIRIGAYLKLPVWEYAVKSGDTLTRIAATLTHVSYQQLAAFNKITNPDRIAVGQVVLIPDPTFLAE